MALWAYRVRWVFIAVFSQFAQARYSTVVIMPAAAVPARNWRREGWCIRKALRNVTGSEGPEGAARARQAHREAARRLRRSGAASEGGCQETGCGRSERFRGTGWPNLRSEVPKWQTPQWAHRASIHSSCCRSPRLADCHDRDNRVRQDHRHSSRQLPANSLRRRRDRVQQHGESQRSPGQTSAVEQASAVVSLRGDAEGACDELS